MKHALKLQARGDGEFEDGVFVRGAARKPAEGRRVSLATVLAAMSRRIGYADPSLRTFANYPLEDQSNISELEVLCPNMSIP